MFPFLLFVASQAADLATTVYGMSRGAKEGNPLVARLLANFGVPGAVFVKVAFIAAAYKLFDAPFLYGFAAYYAAAAAWNLYQIRKQP